MTLKTIEKPQQIEDSFLGENQLLAPNQKIKLYQQETVKEEKKIPHELQKPVWYERFGILLPLLVLGIVNNSFTFKQVGFDQIEKYIQTNPVTSDIIRYLRDSNLK
jgi:hypothetical protein